MYCFIELGTGAAISKVLKVRTFSVVTLFLALIVQLSAHSTFIEPFHHVCAFHPPTFNFAVLLVPHLKL